MRMISAHKFPRTFAPKKEKTRLKNICENEKDINNRYKMFIVDIICDFKQIILFKIAVILFVRM